MITHVSSGNRYRTSLDSAWPLRAPNGQTFAERKEHPVTRNDIIDLYARSFDVPHKDLLLVKGEGARRRRRIRTALIVALVDHFLRVSGEHVAASAHKVIAGTFGLDHSAVRQALQELPILKALDPAFATTVEGVEEKLAKLRCAA
jgi:hypothetical protein